MPPFWGPAVLSCNKANAMAPNNNQVFRSRWKEGGIVYSNLILYVLSDSVSKEFDYYGNEATTKTQRSMTP